MLQPVDVGARSLDTYRDVAPSWILEELRTRAERLRGTRVLHLNATPYGGGVSELLRSAVPLLNDLGLVADWRLISGDDNFFHVTKTLHNALQGADRMLTPKEQQTYERTAERNARAFEEEYDYVVVHDPQPAGVLRFHGRGNARWIWRCHIDTSSPNEEAWGFLRPYLEGYDAAVVTMAEFLPPSLPIDQVAIIPPAIDPLSPKNLELEATTARQVLDWIGIELDRPLVTQVARFDPWKDPLGLIEAYRLAREDVDGLQLALVGSMALDDPEAWDVYRQIESESRADPLIHVFTNLTGVGNIEVNAFQRLSELCVQKSIREGFGLVVSEALWKGTPVVAGRAGGIPLQMADATGGLLVESVEECARAMVELLADPSRARDLGRLGRERVREHFLLPRLLLNELSLMDDLAAARPLQAPSAERDPVCGMSVDPAETTLVESVSGSTFRFCSEDCRARFHLRPERYFHAAGSPR